MTNEKLLEHLKVAISQNALVHKLEVRPGVFSHLITFEVSFGISSDLVDNVKESEIDWNLQKIINNIDTVEIY